MRKACSVVRVCTRVLLTAIVALRRRTLYAITWVHDVSQVAMLVGCRLPENVVEADRSAGLDSIQPVRLFLHHRLQFGTGGNNDCMIWRNEELLWVSFVCGVDVWVAWVLRWNVV